MIALPKPTSALIHVPARAGYYYFSEPITILSTFDHQDIPAVLEELDFQVNSRGRYAAGFLSYEAAPGLDPALTVQARPAGVLPLAWFGIYPMPEFVPAAKLHRGSVAPSASWQAEISARAYNQALGMIREQIACGYTYQVNFTYRLRTRFDAAAFPYFAALAYGHRPPYAAYLETEDWAICSFSPELFFHLQGETLTSRPMKGTAPRAPRLQADRDQAAWLRASEKNQAENVMIVDMVRNDMGRVARTGTVRVPQLFQIEKYPTVWQMTSTVQAETPATSAEIFNALFPCASITGAPKIKTMQMIAGLEPSPRQVYCGAIGYLAPGREAQFNVAIRTLLVDKKNRQAEYGVGGGIVWDSDPQDEWAETQTKARILFERPMMFDLLETMRWTANEGWFLLELHLERLRQSAEYFDFPLDEASIRQKLASLAASFGGTSQRARLKLSRDGQIKIETVPLEAGQNPARVGLARSPVNSSDRFLYHKTSRREVYRQKLAEAAGVDEVLLWNERDELTEATIANLVYEWDGELYTPPVEAGLLPGTYRAWLLAQGKASERTLKKYELAQCSRIFLVNSVRGMWEVQRDFPGISGASLSQITA